MCRSDQHRAFISALELWQSLQRNTRQRPVVLPPWNSAQRLVGCAKLLDEYARQRLQGALAASDAHLAPLRDPLALNLGAHRWLSADREESYSDWLAWIIQGMTAAEILPLFGLDDQLTIDAFGAVVRVLRETIIEDGRTDIQVWFTNGLLLVEVKVQPPGGDLFSQLKRYKQWLDAQQADPKLMVLLGPEETLLQLAREDATDTIEPCESAGWEALCMRLRRHAGRANEFDVMRAAAILIFCGAAEQNLIGLSAQPPRFRAMATVDYLEGWRES